MAHSFSASVFIVGMMLAALAAADTTIPVGENNGRPVTVDVVEPTVGDSKQGDQPVVTKPDEVFTGNFPVGTVQAGTRDGKPVLSGRKMLAATDPVQDAVEPNTLDLSGKGEEVGSSTLGGDAAATGHGTNSKEGGTHIEPHGVTGDVSALGKGVNGVEANANPDGLAGEGSAATVGRR